MSYCLHSALSTCYVAGTVLHTHCYYVGEGQQEDGHTKKAVFCLNCPLLNFFGCLGDEVLL
jgi:hypothetical protein